MRQIKFRVWDVNTMYYESYKFQTTNNDGMGGAGLVQGLDNCSWISDTAIIQQFTGLEDRSGKKIYEGDIIQVSGAGKYPVVWDRYFFDLDNYDQYSMYDLKPQEMTVIGNIFENPDLLK